MRAIYRIPVLGSVARWAASIIRLPKKLDELRQEISAVNERLNSCEARLNSCEARLNSCEARLNGDETRLNEAEGSLRLAMEKGEALAQTVENLPRNDAWMNNLNLQLSIRPILWGDRERLHISPLAAVFTCFFNTNSGEITVGDYTFAGSRVSILAGNHDMYLEGLPRRDAEWKEGCDIRIGQGVWLASGCTILGPCSIGDHAVVAAGAVVTPGTVIPDYAVYAGVPAKEIRTIQTDMEISHAPIASAIEREKGVLFVSGWSEKRYIPYEGKELDGHWLVADGAVIYTNRSEIKFLFHQDVAETVQIIIQQGAERQTILLDEGEKEFLVPVTEALEPIAKLQVSYECERDEKLFVAAIR